MTASREDGADYARARRADALGPFAQPLGGPLGVLAVRSGHVLGTGGEAPGSPRTDVACHTCAAMKQLHRGGAHACIELLANERVRHRVVVASKLDVIVDVYAHLLPLGVFKRCAR